MLKMYYCTNEAETVVLPAGLRICAAIMQCMLSSGEVNVAQQLEVDVYRCRWAQLSDLGPLCVMQCTYQHQGAWCLALLVCVWMCVLAVLLLLLLLLLLLQLEAYECTLLALAASLLLLFQLAASRSSCQCCCCCYPGNLWCHRQQANQLWHQNHYAAITAAAAAGLC
jgi:hypothetical protein